MFAVLFRFQKRRALLGFSAYFLDLTFTNRSEMPFNGICFSLNKRKSFFFSSWKQIIKRWRGRKSSKHFFFGTAFHYLREMPEQRSIQELDFSIFLQLSCAFN